VASGRRFLPVGLMLGAVAFLEGCSNVTVLDPKGQIGAEEKSLIVTAAVLMLIVIVPVIIMAITFAWRYRASNTRARYSPDWSHSRVIEISVWIVPIIIVSILGYLGWTKSHSLDPFKPITSKAKPVTIQVVSLDWKWLFIYPDEHVAAVNEVAFPVNTPVDFFVTSDTVMNSLFIPQLGSQIYSMAGMQTQLHLIANRIGTYRGLSANFSGQGFSGMTFTAIASSQAGYSDWLRKARQSARRLDAGSYASLARASENNPVQFFSSVEQNLFAEVVDKYAGDRMKTMPILCGS
jgi:cytochrome o ubiquinol oxidase subunit 2